jgi:hypothetical protein
MKTRLEKHHVCTSCLAVGLVDKDCICTYSKSYPTIELEFVECECCGHLIRDGRPAETPFNEKQLKEISRDNEEV